MMATKPKQTSPTWSDVKKKLTDFDRAGLFGIIQDLYAASKSNQTFLHARFGLGGDVLAPYKAIIDRWLWPDPIKNQDTSVAAAKKAIADYKKAAGQPEGLAELMVFYCERAAGFSDEYGLDDEGYYDALVRMFEQALKVSITLAAEQRNLMLDRLDAVRNVSHNFGYGVGDDMDDLLAKYGLDFARCGARELEFGLRRLALNSIFPPRLPPQMLVLLRLSTDVSGQGA
jgi:hypothetical protein